MQDKRLIRGKYSIQKVIGKGGMGKVYLALDTSINKVVAIKQTLVDAGEQKDVLERFKREYYFLSAINHRNIIKAYDFFQEQGSFYLVLEYVNGIMLKEFINQYFAKINLKEKLAIAGQIVAAIDVINTSGIIHRDIKPSNIMIDAEKSIIKILDLGIAKSIANEMENLTRTHATIGTPEYMSPEQVYGKISENSDIFSVGVVLYQMFSMMKSSPFRSTSVMATMSNIANKDLPPLVESLNFDISPAEKPIYEYLSKILAKTLDRDENKRYKTAGELYIEIEKLYNACSEMSDNWIISQRLDGSTINNLKALGQKYGQDLPKTIARQKPRSPRSDRTQIHRKKRAEIDISKEKKTLLIIAGVTLCIISLLFFMGSNFEGNINKIRENITSQKISLESVEKEIKEIKEEILHKENELRQQQQKNKELNDIFKELQKEK